MGRLMFGPSTKACPHTHIAHCGSSRAAWPVIVMTGAVMAIGIFLPMGPLASHFKLEALPGSYFVFLVLIVLYQLRKRRYRRKRMEQRRRALENQRRRFREGYDLPVDELEQR